MFTKVDYDRYTVQLEATVVRAELVVPVVPVLPVPVGPVLPVVARVVRVPVGPDS